MGSRKEEERNEKIIRGLMKLPPNRRCINCNSLLKGLVLKVCLVAEKVWKDGGIWRSAICLYQFLDFCLHDLQWDTVRKLSANVPLILLNLHVLFLIFLVTYSREFTHRVKSVSMSKFSSQEVEALQNGGNQRAREIYLKNWDPQRQRLPDSSKVDKVREFIKSVYVDRRYAGGKTSEKPPKDMQAI
ncbi:hypothetical protein Pint_20792 [Pistacia integerrima]|uniref:Uncharacterized protein n=1 Tax=Pistacia integerrima TaxID=434235 RepID=A0ACC0XB15_9ROSI|nr:hypothetical protein Pint_20792 [Pistacia integerrima]